MYNATIAKWNVLIDEIRVECQDIEIKGKKVVLKGVHFDSAQNALIGLSKLIKQIAERDFG